MLRCSGISRPPQGCRALRHGSIIRQGLACAMSPIGVFWMIALRIGILCRFRRRRYSQPGRIDGDPSVSLVSPFSSTVVFKNSAGVAQLLHGFRLLRDKFPDRAGINAADGGPSMSPW